MSAIRWWLRRKLGILPNVNTAQDLFEEVRQTVFTINHIIIASGILSNKQVDDLRSARDLLTVTAIEIVRDSIITKGET